MVEPASWQYADIVKHVDEATLLEHGQRLNNKLWAEFARGGQLPDKGKIEPGVVEWWQA
ncbi:hypothetical protein [Vreelandella sp. EE7]